MSSERNQTIDSVKFILICLVVLAHFLELNIADKDNLVGYNFIFLFHMPLFVTVSGMCFKMKSKEKFLKSCAMLLETYIVCQCYMLFFCAMIEGTPITLKSVLAPQYHLWFIIALLAWRLLLTAIIRAFNITPPLSAGRCLFITILITIACCISGLIPNRLAHYMALSRSIYFFPFFWMGYAIKNMVLQRRLPGERNKPWGAFLLVVALYILSQIVLESVYEPLWGCMSFESMKYDILSGIGHRLLLYVCSSVLCIAILHLVSHKPVMSQYGKFTLPVYIWHAFIVLTIKQYMPSSSLFFLNTLLLTAVVVIAILWLNSHTKIAILLNPISYLVQMYRNNNNKLYG